MQKRRSLLALVGTVILLVSLAAPMMQCAPLAPEEDGEGEEVELYGGELGVGFTGGMESTAMDPALEWTNWGCLFIRLVYDNLAYYAAGPDADFYKFEPRLVQSYEVSEDRKTYTLHLVENAKWHDGEPFTAYDVEFFAKYFCTIPGWSSVTNTFDDIQVIDDYTIKLVHASPLTTVHFPAWWKYYPIIPKHIFEPYKDDILQYPNEEAIGTGPFKLKEFVRDQYMWLAPNEEYWGQRPYVDKVLFRYYTNLDGMLLALHSGEIDTVAGAVIPAIAIKDIQENPDINLEILPGMGLTWLSFNLHKDTPLQDKNVRHAILYGIDRQRIIDLVYLGYAQPYDAWVYNESPIHNSNLPQYAYNPSKAKETLEQAGYTDTDGDGVRNDPATGENLIFELSCSSGSTPGVKMGTVIGEMLPEIGIAVDFKTLDPDTFLDFLYDPESDQYEIGITGEEPAPDPYSEWIWTMAVGWGSGGDWWNASYWNNPRFNELWEEMHTASDLPGLKATLYEMQALMAEDLPYAFLVRPDMISAYRTDKLEGWVNSMGGPVSWMNPWSTTTVHQKGAAVD